MGPGDQRGTASGSGTDRGIEATPATREDRARARGTGRLTLVATPIGNLGDLSPRAVAELAGADIVYCEDTRHSRKLLAHAGVTGVPLRSLHRHNEHERAPAVVAEVAGGARVVVVTDAGLPGVSDPGSTVVAAVAQAGLQVSVVPGPSAALAALVVSGLPTDRFAFEGFLPRRGADRRARLATVAAAEVTTVLFESPGRVAATLADLADLAEVAGGGRRVAVVRELTKIHEEVWRGSLEEAAARTAGTAPRGEVVLVVEGAPPGSGGPPPVDDGDLRAALAPRLAAGERLRGVVDDVAAATGVPRRRVYDVALDLAGALEAGDGPPPAP